MEHSEHENEYSSRRKSLDASVSPKIEIVSPANPGMRTRICFEDGRNQVGELGKARSYGQRVQQLQASVLPVRGKPLLVLNITLEVLTQLP